MPLAYFACIPSDRSAPLARIPCQGTSLPSSSNPISNRLFFRQELNRNLANYHIGGVALVELQGERRVLVVHTKG